MSVVEYHARFLMLERWPSGTFVMERERVAWFDFGLNISLTLVLATFLCPTLAKTIMRALECEHAHEFHH